tara:strand:+ start:16 stop:417 length:402 start_codon:yes stop_codon:yes gene_type:complete
MWRKNFDQFGKLTSFVEYNKYPQSIICDFEYENNDSEDENENDDIWNPNTALAIEWTKTKLSKFLSENKKECPKLLEILQKQRNVHNKNYVYLCKFRAYDDTVNVWISGSLLHHNECYKEHKNLYDKYSSMSN